MIFFVITPHFVDPMFEAKKRIVVNVSTKLGVEAQYGASPPYNATDSTTIYAYKQADFFIGDLSYERPSSYFEIGLVQGMNKPIDLIAMSSTNIHQVFNRDKVIYYQNIYEYEKFITFIINSRFDELRYR